MRLYDIKSERLSVASNYWTLEVLNVGMHVEWKFIVFCFTWIPLKDRPQDITQYILLYNVHITNISLIFDLK